MCNKKIRFLLFAAFTLISLGLRAQFCNFTVDLTAPSSLTCQNPSTELQVVVTPAGNYQYRWAGPVPLPDVPNPTITVPGSYVVIVTDNLQCWVSDTVVVVHDGTLPIVSVSGNFIGCEGHVEFIASASVTGGGTLNYAWSTGATDQTIVVPTNPPGVIVTYCVTVTNSDGGCTSEACMSVGSYTQLSAEIIENDSPFCGDTIGLSVSTQGGFFPYAYLWNNGATTNWQANPPAGTYIVTVTDSRGCSVVNSVVVENEPGECTLVEGHVLADWNTNCTQEPSDAGLANIIIRITDSAGNEYFTNTDADGFYQAELFAGTYTLEVIKPNNLWAPCEASYTVTILPNEPQTRDFLLQPAAICPAMTVDIGVPFLRRCFSNTYWVNYCNQGTAIAQGAYIEIQFDDFLSVTSSSAPLTDLGNNLYRFDLGVVTFNECGNFSVNVQVSCDAILGQTHCTEAVIYPTGSCDTINPLWSGASLQVLAECNTDSLEFTIRNVGNGSTSEPLEYVIIEDAVMFMNAPPPAILLAPNEEHRFKVPANGATWRVEVEQEAFHPGLSVPMRVLEGCANGGSFSVGFVNQFPLGDNDPWTDIDCTENIGAYDPNDKQGFPLGYGAARYIKPRTELEYLIRFQNTGTDTAFTVVIRDTLSAWLDAATVRPGASSHPYTFEFYGDRNIKFTFDNILLPDSNTNLAASNGFVSFRIAQKSDVPLQTDILNSAAIFFDFNEPVITNTTVHRVGEDFITVSAWQPFRQGLELRMLPNPVAQTAVLELRGLTGKQDWQVELRDVTGRLVHSDQASGEQWHFERGQLPAGLYLLQVRSNGQLMGSGKVVLR